MFATCVRFEQQGRLFVERFLLSGLPNDVSKNVSGDKSNDVSGDVEELKHFMDSACSFFFFFFSRTRRRPHALRTSEGTMHEERMPSAMR